MSNIMDFVPSPIPPAALAELEVLVDPADPRRCLWIEGWPIESIGD